MVVLIVALAAGTVVEKLHGSDYALSHVYGSWWFVVLWVLLVLAGAVFTFFNSNWRRPAALTLFLAVVFILLGALLAMLTGQHGEMTLVPDVAVSRFSVEKQGGTVECELPFSLTLSRFEIETYPGSSSPMDFVSHLQINDDDTNTEVVISMNNILKHRGFRFYQSDYDDDGNSVLSVSYDPWGIGVTYTGCALLLLAVVFAFAEKNGEFRTLLRKVSGKVSVLFVFFVCGGVFSVEAANKPRAIPRECADKMGQLYVMYKGRVCPLQTLAKDFTTRLYGSSCYMGLSPEQVLSGWMFYCQDWKDEPMIKIKDGFVREQLGIKGKYASKNDFIDAAGENKLTELVKSLPVGDPRRKKYSDADEKYQLVAMLNNGRLLKMFPHVDTAGIINWYSQNDNLPLDMCEVECLFIRKQLTLCRELVLKNDFKALNEVLDKTKAYQEKYAFGFLPSQAQCRSECLYNHLSIGKWLAIVCVILGSVCFALSLVCLGKMKPLYKPVRILGMAWMALLCVFLSLLLILRWIIGGHVPMAGSFDSMNLMALAICFITLFFARRYEMALPAGLLTSGFVLLVQMMGGPNPPVTHLMPVLASPLLSLHVSVIMIAYALLFFIMLNGVSALLVRFAQPANVAYMERLRDISRLMLYPAVALLATGIFVGTIWANISWGNFWSWDPKEVWALITLLVYGMPLLSDVLLSFRKPMFFHVYSILAFLSVVITYFGVNLILGGVHSYA